MPRESTVARKHTRKAIQNASQSEDDRGTPVFPLRAKTLLKVGRELKGKRARVPDPGVSDNSGPTLARRSAEKPRSRKPHPSERRSKTGQLSGRRRTG